jgi:hypothetical protein
MTLPADIARCSGALGNDWRIRRDCIDCRRYTEPNVVGAMMRPPEQVPCPERIDAARWVHVQETSE